MSLPGWLAPQNPWVAESALRVCCHHAYRRTSGRPGTWQIRLVGYPLGAYACARRLSLPGSHAPLCPHTRVPWLHATWIRSLRRTILAFSSIFPVLQMERLCPGGMRWFAVIGASVIFCPRPLKTVTLHLPGTRSHTSLRFSRRCTTDVHPSHRTDGR